MQSQFTYLVQTAQRFQEYLDDPEQLLEAIHSLETDTLQQLFETYSDPDHPFKPIRLFRAEVARRLLKVERLSLHELDQIQQSIQHKEIEALPDYPGSLLRAWKKYRPGQTNLFSNWKHPWNLLYPFLYRGTLQTTVEQYLEQLGNQLMQDLQLEDYLLEIVDFSGQNHFGSSHCWLALYPATKNSPREAYQFLLQLSANPIAGRTAGNTIRPRQEPNKIREVSTYQDAVQLLQQLKPGILQLNQNLRSYFKFLPGPQADHWEEFFQQGIAAVDYSNFPLEDVSNILSLEALNQAAGLPADSQSNQTWNLWLFSQASKGDVVFATKGVNTCLGIGIIDGPYRYAPDQAPFCHQRRVKWLTRKPYQYISGSRKNYKTLFRPDTFSPTKVWEFLFNEYVRLYPELRTIFETHQLPVSNEPITTLAAAPLKELPIDESVSTQYWWLNVSPQSLQELPLQPGETFRWSTRNSKGLKHRVYKYFEMVHPDDQLLLYATSPERRLLATAQVIRGLHRSQTEEWIECEMLDILEVPIYWQPLKNILQPAQEEISPENPASLLKLSERAFEQILELIEQARQERRSFLEQATARPYSYRQDPDQPFIPAADFEQWVRLLEKKKNLLLQGPPGVGKTFIAKKLAFALMGYEHPEAIELVQFHQSYSYEDFVQGLRPGPNGFEVKDGLFLRLCQRAKAYPEQPFFLIIDEINRGNLSKIFGELLMLLEADKRSAHYQMQLTYAAADAAPFYIPANVYLIGTMNTADRSLAILDYALRRRFVFVDLVPHFGEAFEQFLRERGMPHDLLQHLCQAVAEVNKTIREDRNLGSGFQIGHSYFCNYHPELDAEAWYRQVLEFEIRPLLQEIWFDDPDQVQHLFRILTRA